MTQDYFTESELACKCGCGKGKSDMDQSFLLKLNNIRHQLGFPLPVSSGYRCPKYNQRVSSTGTTGPHTTGRAVDIVVSRERAYKLMKYAMMYGITGIGVKQKDTVRFLHLDDLEESEGRPRPTVWSY